jgi:hypothetical protein
MWMLLFPAGNVLGQIESGTQTEPESALDFATDVLPILKSRCFECHSKETADGDLRLDTKLNALRGGHTGNPVLGTSTADSELIQRIISDEDGYRMPKEGSPLSQNQIEILTKWIDGGSDWPAGTVAPGKDVKQKHGSFIDWLADQYLLIEQPRFRYAAIVIAAWLAMLVAMLAYRFLAWRTVKNAKAAGESVADRTVHPTMTTFATIATVFALMAVIGYQYGQIETLTDEGTASTALSFSLTNSLNESESSSARPEVPKPMHLPRLGGIYYRGNDERSPELFNGGFYRTAELLVRLVDRNGAPIEFGDAVSPNELSIEFKATRAAGATQQLFSPRTMRTAFVSSKFVSSETESDRRMLESQDDGESWTVSYPLGLNASTDEQFTGTLYVYYGPFERNRIHYAISYSLNIEDGRVANDSEIWMGSAYNLAGRVIYPRGDQIALDRWFDFRPIPEIEGKNSENPKLLGLPEHLPTKAASPPLNNQ